MADFDDDQIRSFVERWFRDDEVKGDNCWQALRDSKNETLKELAQVPLLLSLLCIVYEERNEFPRERDEIYKQATDALLVKWDASRNITRHSVYEALTLRRKQQMLAHLAAQTFEDGHYFLKEEKVARLIEGYLQGVPGLGEREPDGSVVLKEIEAQYGILVERARGIHSFSHLTLQEYYTARYIVDNEARGAVEGLMAHVGDYRWREVFLLTAGMLDDATDFCRVYLVRLDRMVAGDEIIVDLLRWATHKGALAAQAGPGASRASMRALYVFLERTRDLDFARDVPQAHDRDFIGNVPRVPDLVRPRDLIGARALARALSPVCVPDFELDPDFVYDVALSSALLRQRTRDLDLALKLNLNLVTAYGPIMDLDYHLVMTRNVLFIARYLETLGKELAASLRDVLRELQSLSQEAGAALLKEALGALPAPAASMSRGDVEALHRQLNALVREHRDLGHDWKLSREQGERLATYLQATHLLVECLQLAYVPDRQAIKDRLLLPPNAEDESA